MTFLKAISVFYLVFLVIYLLLRFTLGDSFWWLSLLNTFALLLFIPLPLALLVAWLQKALWLRLLSIGVTLATILWFGSYFVPKSVSTVTGQSITLLSYNMQSKPEGLESFLHNQKIDIVFLQEISPEYTQTLSSLVDLYPYQAPQSKQWENAVLSAYPILKAENLSGFEPSIPQRLELDINGKIIAVYNVHPIWPIGNPRLNIKFLPGFILKAISGFDDSQRNAQIDLLIEYLENETLPYLVAGDFNTSQYSATYNKIAKIAKDSFREVEMGFGNSWPAKMQSGLKLPPLLRLDYVWHSQEFQATNVEVQKALAGDHFPILAMLSLRH